MGSSTSTLVGEVVVTGAVLGLGAYFLTRPSASPPSLKENVSKAKNTAKKTSAKKNANKNKKDASALTSSMDTLVNDEKPSIKVDNISDSFNIPGSLPSSNTPPAPEPASKSAKKRKSKAAPSSSTLPVPSTLAAPPVSASTTTDDDGEGWTKISKEKSTSSSSIPIPTTSTTPATTSENDVAPQGEPPALTTNKSKKKKKAKATVGEQTLAEQLLPKAPSTAVDDMLDGNQGSIARVMRVTSEDSKPADGFSWGDYEETPGVDSGAAGSASGDAADDDDGWGVVKSRKPRTPGTGTSTPGQNTIKSSITSNSEPTKKQRQNDAKKAALKALKADQERERLATLARHKRELEKSRIEEAYKKGNGKKVISGGMQAKVGPDGSMYFE